MPWWAPSVAVPSTRPAWPTRRVSGEIPGPIGPAHVVELRSVPNIAAGVVPWGVADPLSTLVPGTTAEQLDPTAPTDSPHTAGTTGTTGTVRPPGTDRSSDAAQLDPHAATRDVVAPPSAAASTGSDGSTDVPGVADGVGGVLARAAGRRLVVVLRDGRRPAAAALASALVEARPDAVVVDMGWPSDLAAGPSGVRVSTYGASRASGESVARLLAGRDASTSMSASTSAATVATSATAGRSPRG